MELRLQVPDPELEEKGSGQVVVPKRVVARCRRLKPLFGPPSRYFGAYSRHLEESVLQRLNRAQRALYFRSELTADAYKKIIGQKSDESAEAAT
jgi:hypothetical protein